VPSPVSDVYDDKADAEDSRRVSVEAEEEEGEEEVPEEEEEEEEEETEDEGEEEGGGRRRGGTREQRHERWRECALYREAQRHTGTPNARKTHRHLGIFGLRGFPAELEHTREFVPPEWALPRDDPRLDDDETSAVPVVGPVGRGGETPDAGVGVGEGVGAVGAADAGKEADEAHLDAVVMAVTVAEDAEKTLLEVDPVMAADTPKTVDSQETEDLMLFI